MRLKSDQALSSPFVTKLRTGDIRAKPYESILALAIWLKLAQFLLRVLRDEHQVVPSMFVRRGIDALFRLHFGTKPNLLCAGWSDWQPKWL